MEDNSNRRYVNISDKPYTPAVYNEEDKNIFSYKPTSGFWLSLETDDEYYSEWDREYRDTLNTDKDGNLHATTVKLRPTTYTLCPGREKTLLEGFHEFTSKKEMTPEQKRKLLVELVRTRKNDPSIENVICQIDLVEDVTALEEIFGGYKLGESHPDEVYQNLASNVKKGIRESFSGLEVTAYALGLDETSCGDDIVDTQCYWACVDPKYHETIDYFEMASVVIFDTSCLDVIEEITYPQETKTKEGEERED